MNGPGERYWNQEFTRAYVENPPDSFVSFNEDAITGYWIDFKGRIHYKVDEIATEPGKETHQSISSVEYNFMGWEKTNLKADAGTVEYEMGATYRTNASATLYAVWETNLILSKENPPVLGEGMQAVYWSDENATSELTADSFTTSMYSYKMGDGINDTKEAKWANAKTEDGSYWVWIPRYADKLTYYTNTNRNVRHKSRTSYGDVDILFMYGTSNTHYRDNNGNPQPLPEGYIVHPAFQKMTTTEDLATNPLGKWDSELEGIWVAKYEASREDSADGGITWAPTTANYGGGNNLTTKAGNTSSTQIRVVVKPSIVSWKNIRPTNIYTNCEAMYPTLNSHQMKNSEWGAVSYLAYSPYGRNGNELAVNQCSDCYTGAGKGIGSSTVYNSTYSYLAETKYDSDNNISAYGFAETYAWNTDLGRLASSTGNIYGVYDVSGGAWEYVASYLANGNSGISSYGNSMYTSPNLRNKQVYTSTISNGGSARAADYALCSENVYGDAVCEVSADYMGNYGWYSDYSYFPGGSSIFFGRGGSYYDSSSAGMFNFGGNFGFGYTVSGFRPVLCVTKGS